MSLFGFGHWAKADTFSFAYWTNNIQPNTNVGGSFSTNLAQATNWYDLASTGNSTPQASTYLGTTNGTSPGINDTAQFDAYFTGLNPTAGGTGGPGVTGNVAFTLSLTQATTWGALNILSPGVNPMWQSGSTTNDFVMTITGSNGSSAALALGGGGITVTNDINGFTLPAPNSSVAPGYATASGTDVVITAPMNLLATQTWNINPVSQTLAGTVSFTTALTVSANNALNIGASGAAQVLTIQDGGNVSIGAQITDAGTNNGQITVNNTGGTVTLTCTTNTFGGGINLEAGAVSVPAANALGANHSGVNFDGGLLVITGTTFNNLNTFEVSGSNGAPVTGDTGNGYGAGSTWSNFPLNLDLATANNDFTVAQSLAGSLALNLSGAGTLILTQTNNGYTGGTTIGAGALLIAPDAQSLGSGSFTNNGNLEFTSSTTISGNGAGNGGIIIGGGLGSTLTLTNVSGAMTNQTVGVTGLATLVLDFTQGTAGSPIVAGQLAAGPNLLVGGGNVVFNASSTPTTQVFGTTTFSGGVLSTINVTGNQTVGNLAVQFGTWNVATNTSSLLRSVSDSNPQYGSTVNFNGPFVAGALVGAATSPVSDYYIVGNTFSAASALIGYSGSGINNNAYENGYATYGLSDWAAITLPSSGISYIVPGSAIGINSVGNGTGFYTPTSLLGTTTTTGPTGTTGTAVVSYSIHAESTSYESDNVDVTANAPISMGSEQVGTIRFNSPTGGYTTAGGNTALTMLSTAAPGAENVAILITPNIGTMNVLFADATDDIHSNISSQGAQDIDLSRGAQNEGTIWNNDYQNFTAGIVIVADSIAEKSGDVSGITLVDANPAGQSMFAFVGSNYYSRPTSLENTVLEIQTDQDLGGGSDANGTSTQSAVDLSNGALITNGSIALNNSIFNPANLVSRGINISPLGGTLASVTSSAMTVTGNLSNLEGPGGNLAIGFGTYEKVHQGTGVGSSTLGLALAQGNGTVVLSGTNTGFTGNIAVNHGAVLQADGTYSGSTQITVNNGTLLGATTSTLAGVTVNSGSTFFPGDGAGTGPMSITSLTLNSQSDLSMAIQGGINPGGSATDLLTLGSVPTSNVANFFTNTATGTVDFSLFQTGTTQPFYGNASFDLVNVLSASAFNVSGTLASPNGSTAEFTHDIGGLVLTNPELLTTYSLSTVNSGGTTQLELTVSSNLVIATWNNVTGGGGNPWETATDWTPNTVPNGPVDIANFPTLSNAASIPVAITAPETVGQINFYQTNGFTNSYAIGTSGTGSLTISNGSTYGSIINSWTGTDTVSAAISATFGAELAATNTAGTLVMNGSISGPGQPVYVNGTPISGGTIAGTGTVVFGASEAYTGSTSIYAGTLQLGNGATNGSIVNTSSLLNNGTLVFNEVSGTTYGFATAMTGSGGIIQNGANTEVILDPPATYGGTTAVTINAGTIQLGDAAGGNLGTVTIAGGAKLDLNGITPSLGIAGSGFVDNTSSTPINLSLNAAGTATFAGTIEDSNTAGTVSLSVNGPGLLVLSGTNTYEGSTSLGQNGFLQVNDNLALPPASVLTLNSPATNGQLVLGSGATLSNTIINNNSGTEFVNVAVGAGNGDALLDGPVTTNGQWRMGDAGNSTSTLYVTGAETVSGDSYIIFNAGNIVLGPTAAVATPFSLTANVNNNLVTFGRGGPTPNLALTLNGNATITATGTADVSMGYSGPGFDVPEVTITMNSAAQAGVLGGGAPYINLNSNVFNMDQSGDGTAYLGTLNLNGGTLAVGQIEFAPANNVAANAVGVINFNGGILVANANNANFLPNNPLTNAGAGVVTMNVGAGGIKIDTNGYTEGVTDPGGIRETGAGETVALEKDGSGALIFSPSFNNDDEPEWQGGVVVNGGLVEFGGPAMQNASGIDNLELVSFIKVAAGGAIGEDDGVINNADGVIANGFSSIVNELTGLGYNYTGSPSLVGQSGGLALSTPDANAIIDYTGALGGSSFNMTNPTGNGVSLANMSIGAVADGNADVSGSGNAGTLGVPVIFTGTIHPGSTATAQGSPGNTYLLGGGGTLELASASCLAGASTDSMLIENGGAVYLAASNAYTGRTTISGTFVQGNTVQGTNMYETSALEVNGLSPTDSSIGASSNGNPASLIINGGELSFIGSNPGGTETSGLAFTVGQYGADIDSSGTGSLTLSYSGQEAFQTAGVPAGTTYTFTLSGSEGTVGTIASITAGTATSTNTFSGSFTAPAGDAVALVKIGAGVWTITGDSYNGGASINQGVLQLGANGALNTAGAPVTVGATLDMNGYNASVGPLSGGGTVDNITSSGNSTLTIVPSATFGVATFTGVITNTSFFSGGTGTTSIVLNGNGTQALTGSNTYSGSTTILAGTLQVGTGGTAGELGGAANQSITDNGLLEYDQSSNISLGYGITGSGGFATIGSGTVTLTGSNSYLGTTTVNGGTLVIPSTTALPVNATTNIVDNANLVVLAGTSSSPVILGNISENTVAGSPVNTGTGQLYIGNASTVAYVQLHTNSHTSVVSGLTLGAGSTLDISNNTVSIQFGSGADPISSIVAALSAGYASGWTGAAGASGAITSSTAAANNFANASPVLSIGYSDGNYDPTLAANAAASATAGQILIKMTLAGDAYLTGSVNFNDLDVLGRHYNTTGNDWAQGNFNYAASGAVNFNDLDIIGLNYNQNIGSLGSSGIESGGSTLALGLNSGSDEIGGSDSSPVAESVSVTTQTTIVTPEPGTLCILAAGAGGLLARRRRRTTK